MPVPARARRVAAPVHLLAAALWLSGCGLGSLIDDDRGSAVEQTVPTDTGAAGTDDPVGSTTAGTPATTTSTIAPPPPLDPTFEAIADRATLTGEGRRLLSSSSPELDDVAALAQVCTLETEVSVLGCYRSGRIAVLAVTDPRLDGMIEVTTAHEVLHAAWATYDGGEREQLGALLRAALERAGTPDLDERIELYRQRDPGSVDGELYSILGTEVADIGPELEDHYRRWFEDRSVVVALAANVQSTFASLKASVDELDARLDALRADIDTREAALDAERASIDARSQELDDLRSAGRIEEYNAAIDPFNARVAAYNDAVAELEQLIGNYNALAAERNALAEDYTALVGQITTAAEEVDGS